LLTKTLIVHYHTLLVLYLKRRFREGAWQYEAAPYWLDVSGASAIGVPGKRPLRRASVVNFAVPR
jgi:hypothetical protein